MRYLKLALLRFYRKQRTPLDVPPLDETLHYCKHCGYAFVGRVCPQCGMPGDWTRFTAKKLFLSFLDIWGMGNRPMFRSMGHLLWRPGYMIRDYLGGHYLSYFPPFKMLAVLTVLVALTVWALGVDVNELNISESIINAVEEKDISPTVLHLFQRVADFFGNNTLYRLLLQISMLVLAIWIVFRRWGLNFVETFFAIVYISCQMQLFTIAWLLLMRELPPAGAIPYSLPYWLMIPLLIADFRQLYGLSIWGAVWRTFTVFLVIALLYAVVLVGIIVLLLFSAPVETWLS